MWAAARNSWKSLWAFHLSSRLAPHFPVIFFKLSLLLLILPVILLKLPVIFFKFSLLLLKFSLLFFKLPVIFFRDGSGEGRGKRERCRFLVVFSGGMGQKIPRFGGDVGRGGGFVGKSLAKNSPLGRGCGKGRRICGKKLRRIFPLWRGSGKGRRVCGWMKG